MDLRAALAAVLSALAAYLAAKLGVDTQPAAAAISGVATFLSGLLIPAAITLAAKKDEQDG